MLAGHSIFIKSSGRLKRVFVSNPAVLDSFTSSPTEIVVTAKAAGVSNLILWNQDGDFKSYAISADVDVVNLKEEMRHALPNDNIDVVAHQDRISLSGTVFSDATASAAGKLAALYGKDVVNALVVQQVHPRQVKLKVQIIEVDRSKLEQFGINIFSQGKNTAASGTGQYTSLSTATTTSTTSGSSAPVLTISSPLNLLLYNSGLNVGLTLQDLLARQIAQILAEPTITAMSGEKASFLSGGEFPFPVVQGSSGGLTSISIQFRPYGVKLDFTPVINSDGTIQLKVAPEVSALDYTNAVTISGYTIPAISTRRADTEVELRDGQSFAISGLLDNRTSDILNKMPGIGDLPILGQLFRSKSISRSVAELMVVVTPTLVDPLTDSSMPITPKQPVPKLDVEKFDQKLVKKAPASPAQPGKAGTP